MRSSRVPWTVVSQALWAACSALVVVVAAQRLSDRDLGTVSLVLTGVVLVQSVVRCVVGQPLLIDAEARGGVSQFGAAVGVGLVASGGVGVLALATSPWWGATWPAVAFAVGCVVLSVLDVVRFVAVAREMPWVAALGGAVWLSSFALVALLAGGAMETGASILAVWVATAGIGLVVSALVLGAWRWWRRGGLGVAAFVRRHRRVAAGLLGDTLMVSVYGNATPFVVALLSTVEETGSFRVAVTVVGPIMVVITGAAVQALSDMSRASSAGPLADARRRLAVRLGVLGAGYAVVVALVPAGVGEAVFGRAWESSRVAAILLAVSASVTAVVTPAIESIRAWGATSAVFRRRAALLPVQLAAVVGGAVWAGAEGAAAGLLVGNVVSVVPWWRLAARVDRAGRADRVAGVA